MHSLTFTSWIHPENPPSRSILHAKQVELAPGSSQTTQNLLVSKVAKSTDQQNKF